MQMQTSRAVEHVGQEIAARRRACELTQKRLAQLTGVCELTVWRLERDGLQSTSERVLARARAVLTAFAAGRAVTEERLAALALVS